MSEEYYKDKLEAVRGIDLPRLRELASAERAGRVVVLPCKVGDVVFALARCGDVRYFCDNDYETGTGATTCPFEKQCGIEECDNDDLHVFAVEVAGFYLAEENPMNGVVIVNELDINLSLSDFGKRVFITEAEAERALSGAGEGSYMIKRNESITPERLKHVRRMSIKTVCDLIERVHLEIAAAYPRFDEPLETCYGILFDELYDRDRTALVKWIKDKKRHNPYKYFAPHVGAGEGTE